MHSAEATLAEPERPIDVDDNESADAVQRARRCWQDLSERQPAREGRRGEDPWPVLHPVAEGREDQHADRDGEEGEFCVTILQAADQRGVIMSRSRRAGRNASPAHTNELLSRPRTRHLRRGRLRTSGDITVCYIIGII